MDDDWTDAEIDATVREYFTMMDKHKSGQKFVKTHVYKALERNFPNRTWKAFERKFCNISAVLDEMGRGWIPGLKPLRNYQNRLGDRVRFFLSVGQPASNGESADDLPKQPSIHGEAEANDSPTTEKKQAAMSEKQGRPTDPRVRKAVELRAMVIATELYRGNGYSVEDVSGNHPYDLCCIRDRNEIHVEVKGTQGAGNTVVITRNELKHARDDSVRTDLIVVTEISITYVDGEAIASGGFANRIRDWVPADHDLDPIAYEYTVP